MYTENDSAANGKLNKFTVAIWQVDPSLSEMTCLPLFRQWGWNCWARIRNRTSTNELW